MRIVGSIVARNEESRYLEACLRHMTPFFDAVFFYDDQSTDNTVMIAKEHGCVVVERPDTVPSFMEHEGQFRQAAWDEMTSAMELQSSDWVYSFDADEFLVSNKGDVRRSLEAAASHALSTGHDSVKLPFVEVFNVTSTGLPQQRIDGLWNRVIGTRFIPFRPNGVFVQKPMGCGSTPAYPAHPYFIKGDLYVLHYGYAMYEDRCAKYDRYKSLPDHGHQTEHIDSIVKQPELIAWTGPVPDVGVRFV